MPNERPHILYDNRLEDGTPTATSTASGFPVYNVTDWRRYTYWKPVGVGTQYITVDCGTAKAADALAIVSHDLKTRGATVSVEASSDAFAADVTGALAPFAVASDKPVYKVFASVTKRYWRLKIDGLTAACFIGIVVIGARLTFNRYPVEGFDPLAEEPVAEDALSTTGQLLGVVNRHVQRKIRAEFQHVNGAWFTDTFKPAWDAHLSKHKPFVWVWDPTGSPDDVSLVFITPGFQLSAPFRGVTRSFTLEMAGVND